MRGFIAVCALLGCSPQRAAAPVTHSIAIDGMQFVPASIDVHPGDSVVWINKDLVPHTATADDTSFDSLEIAPNAKWEMTIRRAGVIGYHCTLHRSMKGTLKAD